MKNRNLTPFTAEQYDIVLRELKAERFVEELVRSFTIGITWASNRGKKETLFSGYGCRESPLRAYDPRRFDVKEDVLKTQVLPIFEQQGYTCELSRHSLAHSIEQYFKVKISW